MLVKVGRENYNKIFRNTILQSASELTKIDVDTA